MLSVLHVLSSLELGGAETFTIELAKLQRKEGVTTHILNLSSEKDLLVPQVRRNDVPLTISEKHQSRWQRYKVIHALFQQFDVIHIHSPKVLMFLAPLLIVNQGKRFIYTRHGLDPLEGWYWRIVHFFIQPLISQVTFVTEAGKEVFRSSFTWPESKIRVIENGVYIPDRSEANTRRPIRFGSVGRMVGLKGQKNLLKAIHTLINQDTLPMGGNYSLHFFGNGPLEQELKDMSAGIDIENIVFHGIESDINRLYQNIDVLVVASETEGLSMVIIEAMARGKPVIATRVGGNPSLVLPGVTGVLVDYGDVPAMARALKSMIVDSGQIEALGTGAREFITKNFSLAKTHRAFLECYGVASHA